MACNNDELNKKEVVISVSPNFEELQSDLNDLSSLQQRSSLKGPLNVVKIKVGTSWNDVDPKSLVCPQCETEIQTKVEDLSNYFRIYFCSILLLFFSLGLAFRQVSTYFRSHQCFVHSCPSCNIRLGQSCHDEISKRNFMLYYASRNRRRRSS